MLWPCLASPPPPLILPLTFPLSTPGLKWHLVGCPPPWACTGSAGPNQPWALPFSFQAQAVVLTAQSHSVPWDQTSTWGSRAMSYSQGQPSRVPAPSGHRLGLHRPSWASQGDRVVSSLPHAPPTSQALAQAHAHWGSWPGHAEVPLAQRGLPDPPSGRKMP